MNSFYTKEELKQLGLKRYGKNVLISKKCSIYGEDKISIGNNVRIDDYSILAGNITIGNYVHISAFCALHGRAGIEIGNYCGISGHSILYSEMDDFSGNYFISPMVKQEWTNVTSGEIRMEDYTQIGANSIVFPNITIHKGAVCGAFSLIKSDLQSWTINAGIPTHIVKKREQNLLNFINI